jgi:hypothetical protein
MGKQYKANSGGTSRVRFVLFDAEVPDGEMGSLMQTIQNALRLPAPAPAVQRIAAAPKSAPEASASDAMETEVAEEAEFEEISPAAQSASRQSRQRRTVSRTPKVIDLDMNTEVSLAEFARDKDVGSQAKKYMVCAAWFKEHRSIDAVTEHHIYTCFKAMNWSTNIPNFAQPLRDLKAKQQFFEKSEKGYEINHIGIDFVKKLTRKVD